MPRHSLVSDLLDLSTRMPLWANLLAAGGSFAVLHHFGGSSFPAMDIQSAPDLGLAVAGQLGRVLAYLGQFVIPSCFVLGGVTGWLKRWMRARRFSQLDRRPAPLSRIEAIRNLPWREFETLLGEAFRRHGYATASSEGGVADLELKLEGQLHLAQCRHWRAKCIGVKAVRELHSEMIERQARAGYVVTAGYFSTEAKEFALKNHIHLIDGELLADWLRDMRRPVPAGGLPDSEVATG